MASIGEENPGAPDKDVLAAAYLDDCVLITEDRDFGELIVRQRLAVRGLVLLELERLSSVAEAHSVADVVSSHSDKLLGNLIVIEPRASPHETFDAVKQSI